MNQHRHQQDRGAVLILALVLVVILATVVAALATYTSTALRSSRVTTDIVDTLSSAESGMQYGLARADSGSCPPVFNDGPINGADVTTSCEKAAIVENADGLYALVVTAEGVSPSRDALILTGAANDQNGLKRISGPVYLGEGMSASLTSAAAVAMDGANEVGGSVRYDVVGDCTPASVSPAPPSAWSPPEPVVTCDSRGWQAVASRPDLSSDPLGLTADLSRTTLFSGVEPYGSPSRPLPVPDALSGCVEYSPGWFDGSVLSGGRLSIADPTFFRSGVYYFENVEIDISSQVAVGKRTDLAQPSSPASPSEFPSACATNWGGDSGTGALWILGGTSRIYGTKANVDFYPRQVHRASSLLGPTDMAVISFEAGAAETWNYVPENLDQDAADNQTSQKLIGRANGSQTDISFYGMIYAPAGWVDMGNASNDAYVQFIGGLVVARVDIRIAANVPGFTISVPTTLTDYFLLETVATRNGLETTVRTVSRQTDIPGLEVITWRVL